jgi:hypothetical protein
MGYRLAYLDPNIHNTSKPRRGRHTQGQSFIRISQVLFVRVFGSFHSSEKAV